VFLARWAAKPAAGDRRWEYLDRASPFSGDPRLDLELAELFGSMVQGAGDLAAGSLHDHAPAGTGGFICAVDFEGNPGAKQVGVTGSPT
jgi:hypothetical protein